jgi:hypothetical protein
MIALSSSPLGKCTIGECEIDTGNNALKAQRMYRENEKVRELNKEEVKKGLKLGVIRKSKSAMSSPVTNVKKKDGTNRFCIDYRYLNARTITDAYPMPRIDDLLDQFASSKWFTSLDAFSGYWQIPVKEEDKWKTAFVCGQGLYEWNVMPFGLTNAPAVFQRIMNEAFEEYLYDFVIIYIDDILIYSRNWKEHLEHIRKVFDVLRMIDMKVKLKKCEFGKKNIEYLGHVVGTDGIKPDKKKIEKVKNLKKPENITELRAILGLCGYYRKFVKDFSKIVKPMTELLKKDNAFEWNEKCEKALEILKEKLINYPILRYPDFGKEFYLYTDASGIGLGAVLSQKDEENKEYVIAYISRSLRETEQKYENHERETLAVFWAINYFHKYLYGRKFIVYTDNSVASYIKQQKIPKGVRGKWILELQNYNFEIKHRPGKNNQNADALSRLV